MLRRLTKLWKRCNAVIHYFERKLLSCINVSEKAGKVTKTTNVLDVRKLSAAVRDQGGTPEVMDEILTTARDLESEVNEDDIEELIMVHEDELTIEELQEILNEEHQETQRNVSPSEQEEDERGPMLTSAIKDLLKKWEAVRAMVLE
ncbi:uncharacterized protein TNCV_1069451 [Trichonephila clavipes]|nr:uncharacterized protein TNCV_1069451 [Trichonephila clavipes]